MFVHTRPDSVLKFHKGLYYFETSAPNEFNHSINAYYFLNIVQGNKIFFIEPKLKEWMLPEFYNLLLYSLPELVLKA